MSSWTESELERFYQSEYRSQERLKESGDLGCFYCANIYDYACVEEVVSTDKLALCPICGIDAVMPLSEFPESKWVSLLLAMYLKWFGDEEMTLGEFIVRKFYLYQVPTLSQEEVIEKMEAVFQRSNRSINKRIYSYYGDAISFTIPIYDEELNIYPLNRALIEQIIPAFYDEEELSKVDIKNLKTILEHGPKASFLIELPSSLSQRRVEHIVKLLGLALGGYFAPIEEVPADGKLNREDHIFIPSYANLECDVLDQLEYLLEKYS